jgi:fatty acid desaturase
MSRTSRAASSVVTASARQVWLRGAAGMPPRAWRDSHNYHHARNGRIAGSQIGAYPVMTVAMWSQATRRQRARYRWARHPLGIARGYLTTFAFGMCVAPFMRERWTHASAALEYASYMEAGPVFAWLTGNLGVHHVHHLNSLIPFYRLYEAMDGMPELRTPPNNSLRLSVIVACFRGNLWSPDAGRMVPYPRELAR